MVEVYKSFVNNFRSNLVTNTPNVNLPSQEKENFLR